MSAPRMICACGAVQTAVAYSPYYAGLMFACEKSPDGCRSQDEGELWAQDGREAAERAAEHHGLTLLDPGTLDPEEREIS